MKQQLADGGREEGGQRRRRRQCRPVPRPWPLETPEERKGGGEGVGRGTERTEASCINVLLHACSATKSKRDPWSDLAKARLREMIKQCDASLYCQQHHQ